MKRLSIILLLFTGILFSQAWAQEITMYRLILSDKGDAGYSINRPEEFLSLKAIERRLKQGFAVDETDLPIDPFYFDQLENLGAKVRTHSKWVQTIVVDIEDELILPDIQSLPFVETMYPVWRGIVHGDPDDNELVREAPENIPIIDKLFVPEDYGLSLTQNNLINGLPLHNMGYLGEGISIAVMDGGFYNTDMISRFDRDRIKEAKNFTHEYGNIYADTQEHGTRVLSCMLTNSKGEMIGTAPYADYYLYKTEVNGSEYPVEEDYWVAAIEYADSIGIDIVTTSLGYATFDDPTMNHTHDQLDGHTVPSSRAASMLASKGMILSHAAGNAGDKEWVKINVSSDATDILAVGAVQASGNISPFSSRGYAEDGRVKPDVMAMGSEVHIVGANGFRLSSGTSVACPLITGMTACLWQALPNLTSLQIMDLVRRSADRYDEPNPDYGYGIPDFQEAYLMGKDETSMQLANIDNCLWIDSNRYLIHISDNCFNNENVKLAVYSSMGSRLMACSSAASEVDFSRLAPGLYIVSLQWHDSHVVKKFIRR